MPQPLTTAIAVCYLLNSLAFSAPEVHADIPVSYSINKPDSVGPKIQVAILLDVSNSMDGLIDQAKNQLWNLVKVLSKVTCNGTMPSIEIALYEYGRPENDAKDGFVKQISPFSKCYIKY